MKKIVVFGLQYDKNYGDPLLLDCIDYLLNKKINDVYIEKADLCGRSGYPQSSAGGVTSSAIKNI